MKKILAILLAAMLLLSLAACGGKDNSKTLSGGGEMSLEAAAKEIEKITGEPMTADEVKEAIEQLSESSGKEVTAQDLVNMTRELHELGEKMQSEDDTPKNYSASQKADNAKMEESSHEKLNKIKENSGLSGIGIPEGYSCTSSGSSGNAISVGFRSPSGEVSDDELRAYAAAIWNLCIDAADNSALFRNNKDCPTVDEAETVGDYGKKYNWRYMLDGEEYSIAVEIDRKGDGIKLWSEKY